MKELQQTRLLNTIAYSSQGICFDGTYYYVTENEVIFKYNTSGVKVGERDCSSDGIAHHLGDICVVGGVLYITANNYPNTPKVGYVKEYNANDLSYRNTEYLTDTGTITTGVGYDGADFWTVTTDNIIKKWDTGFTNPTTISKDYQPAGAKGWQGISIDGDSVYLNPHEKTYPSCVQKFKIVGGNLKLDSHIIRPKWCSQGLQVDGETGIFCLRGYGVVPDAILVSQLRPEDSRFKTVKAEYDNTARTYASTTNGENTSLRAAIYAKKGDIIEVQLQGLFKTASGDIRATIDVSSTSATSATPMLAQYRAIRTNSSSNEGISGSQIKHFVADSDGIVTFAMWWRQVSSGTMTCWDRTLTCKIIGVATD